MMKLVERALDAAVDYRLKRQAEHEAWLRSQVREIEALVEQMFGMPFAEAFDRDKARYADNGTTIIDNYILLTAVEDGLQVMAYRYDGAPTEDYVGCEAFERGGPLHHDDNLIRLGLLLAKAHTTTKTEAA